MKLSESKKSYLTYIFIWSICLVSLYFYFPFSVEDSYIVGRYAYNFANYGQLAYNIEEPISALTSPLHAILEGALYNIFKGYDPVVIWKYFSIFLLMVTVATLSRLLTSNTQKIFFMISVLLSSSILLWIVGGLETSLLIFLVSLSTFVFLKENIQQTKTLIKLGLLFGLIFITRFDAAIFMLPISLYIVWNNKNLYKNLFTFVMLPIVIIGLWFIFSKFYYGHFLPTSFFQKTPALSVINFITTIRGLFWTAILPVFVYIIFTKKNKDIVTDKNITVFISLIFVVLYLFTMASKHMMFSFRAFIPYLPISFILLILMKQDISKVIIGLLFIFQTSQLYITYTYGINYPISEVITKKILPESSQKYFYHRYALLNVPNYIVFMKTLEKQGELITLDWEQNNTHEKAVVFTYAEGIASYAARDLFFTGALVTRGACKKPDYVMGLHWLGLKRKSNKFHSENAFISRKLPFYISKDVQQVGFSVSRFKDLNEKNRKAILKRIATCNRAEIW